MVIYICGQLPSTASDRLRYYAGRFPTVEVNYSFYRLPPRSVFETWRAESPDGFLFAVKGSRYLTHVKKLIDPEVPVQRLMDSASGLGSKLGPILFQFVHTWRADVERLDAFLHVLSAYPDQRFTFEFRHASWLVPEVYSLLERAGAALCLPVSPRVPIDIRLTAPWTYIRFHSGEHDIGFSDSELIPWADRILGWSREGADVYVYFNNDPGGHAIHDARRLREMVNQDRG